MKIILITFLPILLFISCEKQSQNLNEAGKDLLKSHQIYVDKTNLAYEDSVYVSIYSDIYSETKDVRFLLTATLSIRNTSLTDSIYINDIDYYDTNGDLVQRFIEKTVLLKPLQSIDYVIEENDTKGGTGANFMVNWGGNSDQLKPIFQGVMISTNGQQGIAFTTEGVSVSRR
jgi:hypothetical protein